MKTTPKVLATQLMKMKLAQLELGAKLFSDKTPWKLALVETCNLVKTLADVLMTMTMILVMMMMMILMMVMVMMIMMI